MLNLSQIKRIHLEVTTRCNARCPLCPRNYHGADYNSGYPLVELSLDDVKKILPITILKQIDQVLINGNLGDFGLARDALDIVEYFVDNDVSVSISTNGSMRTPDWWAKLAHPNVEIHFALDGLDGVHDLYRLDTDWKKIIDNARSFISAGGRSVWKFIIFDHNQHQLDQCRSLSQQLGFVRFDTIRGSRSYGPVFDRDGTYTHHLGNPVPKPPPKWEILLQQHVNGFEKPIESIHKDLPKLNLNCDHLQKKEIYISADGSVFPCCYLGFYPDTMIHHGNQQLKGMVKENNALVYDLEHCLQWFDQVEQSWAKPSIAQGRLFTCVSCCG